MSRHHLTPALGPSDRFISGSSRLWPTSLATCWTRWGPQGKCLSIWTENLRSSLRGNWLLTSWADTSASATSASPTPPTPTRPSYRWEPTAGCSPAPFETSAVCCVPASGLLSGDEAGSDDGAGGSVWTREEHLCESAEASVRASGGRNPPGRGTAGLLRPPFPQQPGGNVAFSVFTFIHLHWTTFDNEHLYIVIKFVSFKTPEDQVWNVWFTLHCCTLYKCCTTRWKTTFTFTLFIYFPVKFWYNMLYLQGPPFRNVLSHQLMHLSTHVQTSDGDSFFTLQCKQIASDESVDANGSVWQVALVSQEPVLFSGSIRENITYGLAGCSLEEIQEAARKANAHEFILRLEKGYDSGEESWPLIFKYEYNSVIVLQTCLIFPGLFLCFYFSVSILSHFHIPPPVFIYFFI